MSAWGKDSSLQRCWSLQAQSPVPPHLLQNQAENWRLLQACLSSITAFLSSVWVALVVLISDQTNV